VELYTPPKADLPSRRIQVPLLLQHATQPRVLCGGRESVLFIGTQFSNLYTAVDTPARGRVGTLTMYWDQQLYSDAQSIHVFPPLDRVARQNPSAASETTSTAGDGKGSPLYRLKMWYMRWGSYVNIQPLFLIQKVNVDMLSLVC
jgi:hypothetical protein